MSVKVGLFFHFVVTFWKGVYVFLSSSRVDENVVVFYHVVVDFWIVHLEGGFKVPFSLVIWIDFFL